MNKLSERRSRYCFLLPDDLFRAAQQCAKGNLAHFVREAIRKHILETNLDALAKKMIEWKETHRDG